MSWVSGLGELFRTGPFSNISGKTGSPRISSAHSKIQYFSPDGGLIARTSHMVWNSLNAPREIKMASKNKILLAKRGGAGDNPL